MATLAELENAIDGLLAHPAGGGNYSLTSRTAPKAYEAYVFGLCLRAAREFGANPILRGIRGGPSPFVFRGGPGHISSTTRNYGYATLSCGKQELELHAGVEFQGASGMLHELDVCLVRADAATRCRERNRNPDSASLVGAWECKFYEGSLDKAQARAFVGLMADMGTNPRVSGFCSNREHREVRDYLRLQRRPDPYLALAPRLRQEANVIGALKAVLNKLCG